jgi:hypothetical protein
MLAQAFGRHAVYRLAVRANNMQCSHGIALLLRFGY